MAEANLSQCQQLEEAHYSSLARVQEPFLLQMHNGLQVLSCSFCVLKYWDTPLAFPHHFLYYFFLTLTITHFLLLAV